MQTLQLKLLDFQQFPPLPDYFTQQSISVLFYQVYFLTHNKPLSLQWRAKKLENLFF